MGGRKLNLADVEQYLGAIHEMMAPHQRGRSAQGWLLENGRRYAYALVDKDRYGVGEARSCFMNAAHLALAHDDLTYVEGYATSGLLPVHHAWCVTADGTVIDTTWVEENQLAEEETRDYYGVPVEADDLAAILVAQEHYGILETLIAAAWDEKEEDAA